MNNHLALPHDRDQWKITCDEQRGQIQYLADKNLYDIDSTIDFPRILFLSQCSQKHIFLNVWQIWFFLSPYLLYCNHKQEANVGDSLSLSKAS